HPSPDQETSHVVQMQLRLREKSPTISARGAASNRPLVPCAAVPARAPPAPAGPAVPLSVSPLPADTRSARSGNLRPRRGGEAPLAHHFVSEGRCQFCPTTPRHPHPPIPPR